MSGFIYFLPGRSGIDPADLERCGLGKVLTNPHGSAAHANTPSGGGGYTVADRSTPIELARIRPGEQTWKDAPKIDGETPYWVGYHNDAKPTPETLKRDEQIDGQPIVDVCGQTWLAPQLRQWMEGPPEAPFQQRPLLPCVCDLNDEGHVTLGEVIPRYREIWNRSWDVASALWPSKVNTGGVMDDHEAVKFSGELLNVNYRVTFLELALLQCFSVDLAARVCRVGIDAEGFLAAVKNLRSRSGNETTSSTCGRERQTTDAQPATSQPLAS